MIRCHFSSNLLVSSYAFSFLLFNLLHFTMATISILTVPWIIALANRSVLHKKEVMTTINEKMKLRNMNELSFQAKSDVSYQELFFGPKLGDSSHPTLCASTTFLRASQFWKCHLLLVQPHLHKQKETTQTKKRRQNNRICLFCLIFLFCFVSFYLFCLIFLVCFVSFSLFVLSPFPCLFCLFFVVCICLVLLVMIF